MTRFIYTMVFTLTCIHYLHSLLLYYARDSTCMLSALYEYCQAVLRVKQELENVRTRLDKAERDVIVSKEESVKLTRSNQDLDKQV